MLGEFTGKDQSDAEKTVRVNIGERLDDTYEVWISREEMVDFLLYAASLDASVATRSKISNLRIRIVSMEFLKQQSWETYH